MYLLVILYCLMSSLSYIPNLFIVKRFVFYMDSMNKHIIDLPKWDLTDLEVALAKSDIFRGITLSSVYTSDEVFEQVLSRIRLKSKEFESYRGELYGEAGVLVHIPISRFIKLVELRRCFLEPLALLSEHISLRSACDTRDEELKKKERQLSSLSTDISNAIRFFRMWFIRLPQDIAYAYADALGVSCYTYKQTYEHGKYVLSEDVERAISLKESASEELMTIFDSFCASLEFDVHGEKKSLQHMRSLLLDENRDVRKLAYDLTTEAYQKHMYLVSNIYIGLVRDYYNECIVLRKYDSPLAVRSTREGISVSALNALFGAVRKNAPLFHRYFMLKAKLLGLDKLESYDVGVGISHSFKKIPFSDAITHLETVAQSIDDDTLSVVRSLYTHVDATLYQHKRGGAFCASPGKGILPYVFMQYEGNFEDMMTFVHEMGHAVHGALTKDLPSDSHHATVGICESASTFFEELVLEQLIGDSQDSDKIALLAQSLQEAFSTIVLQAYVAISEESYHEMIPKGATYDELTDVWHSLCLEMYGDSVNFERSLSWAYRPHIYHSPFYCYNYAIGNILALLLVRLKKTLSPNEFASRYKEYLGVGGRANVVDTARVLGVDLEDSQTWDTAFEILQERLELLENLVKNQNKNL
jgi:oligoendopeptidase F